METFHDNFPSFEKQYMKEQENKNKIQEQIETLERKNKFYDQYKNLSFNDLQIQSVNVIYNDGCIHYTHKITGELFLWHKTKKIWNPYKK